MKLGLQQHNAVIMDTNDSKQVGHYEQANPILVVDVDSLELEQEKKLLQEELVTFWKKGDSTAEKFSETDLEGKYCHETYQQPQSSLKGVRTTGDFYYYESASSVTTASEKVLLESDDKYAEVLCPSRKKENAPSSSAEDSRNTSEHLQSLSNFFTNEEMQMMLPPDSVLSIDDNFFVVLPHFDDSERTLFHCLGHAIFGTERRHKQLRENVVDFICSQRGWDLLGCHVMSFYEDVIDEFQYVQSGPERTKFLKRIYRHYFIDEGMEGSLIELVAASILFQFHYTCMFLQNNDTEQTACRIFHSFEDQTEIPHPADSRTSQTKTSKGKEVAKINYFLRIGQSPNNWRWTIAVPYIQHNLEQPCLSKVLPRGFYQANLWNVHGLNWDGGGETVSWKGPKLNRFYWKNGTVVIYTSSGKLLGGYMLQDRNLFSNLCRLLPNCLHINNRCLLQETIQYCPSKLSLSRLSSPTSLAEAVTRNKARLSKKKSVENRNQLVKYVGTVKDLIKAARIFNVGFYVVGIDEYGAFQTLARRNRDTVLYLIAKTKQDVVTEWCALGDMRLCDRRFLPSPQKSVPQISPPPSVISLNNNSNASNIENTSKSDITRPFLSGKKTKHRTRFFKFVPFKIRISKHLRRLRLFFICWLQGRKNKVYHQKCFPFSDLNIHASSSSSSQQS